MLANNGSIFKSCQIWANKFNFVILLITDNARKKRKNNNCCYTVHRVFTVGL